MKQALKAHSWWLDLTKRYGPLKTLLVLWIMTVVTIVILWFMIQPERLGSMAGTLGVGVVALVGTVLAFVSKKE